jgi:hypothetical protein
MLTNILVLQVLILEASQVKELATIVKMLQQLHGQRFLDVSQMMHLLVLLNLVIAIRKQVNKMKFLDRLLYAREESTAFRVFLMIALKVTSVVFKVWELIKAQIQLLIIPANVMLAIGAQKKLHLQCLFTVIIQKVVSVLLKVTEDTVHKATGAIMEQKI